MECHSLNVSAKVSGVRLGGGMTYTESLLHRFGILGPDGGPGEGLLRGLKDLSSGPLAKLFKSSHLTEEESKCSQLCHLICYFKKLCSYAGDLIVCAQCEI